MKGRSVAELLAGIVVLLIAAVFLVYAVTNSGRASGSNSGLQLRAKFDRIDGLAPGADVRIAGVRVGSVSDQRIDPNTFLAVLTLQVDGGLKLPDDTSAEITSEGLLGGKYVALVPGGGERMLANGGEIQITQSSVSLESLLGRFIFSVTQMAGNKPSEGEQPAAGASPAPAARP
ncbi:outer membrane lipid asymmetry maintenance protein MlaD [Roseomonas sp. BN140053]|uniref:outer membrane lipid asymmetry maintenance protein MlaD n=1 Tax=Roseomonas sp. BN140053 TaxID=3391898 RepID=UPI0039ECE314